MKEPALGRIIGVALTVSVLGGCGAESKVDSVIKGFFSEVNAYNFETAKGKYLSTKLINTLNSPGVPDLVEESFKEVPGQIETVEVAGIEVKGEIATATAILVTLWGAKWQGRMALIKEGGREWKIDNWETFKTLGQEQVKRARQLCDSKNVRAAVTEFEAAVAENPDDAMTLAWWGYCYQQVGNLGAAEEKLRQAIEMHPDVVWDPYIALADVYSRQGKPREAEAAIKKAIRNKPDYARSYNALAWFYAERGEKLERAIELAEKALSLSPDNAAFLDTLGWAYYKKGDREQAVKFLRQARAKAPYDREIQAHYKEVSETAAGTKPSRTYALLVGTWRGTIVQPGYGSYSAVIRFAESGDGHVAYRTLQCGGSLALVKQEGSNYVFSENIEYGVEHNCVTGGKVTLQLLDDGSVNYEWFSGGDNQVGAQGTLVKVR